MKKKIGRLTGLIICGVMTGLLLFQEVQAGEALELANKKGYNLAERYQPAGSIVTEINTGMILWEEDARSYGIRQV